MFYPLTRTSANVIGQNNIRRRTRRCLKGSSKPDHRHVLMLLMHKDSEQPEEDFDRQIHSCWLYRSTYAAIINPFILLVSVIQVAGRADRALDPDATGPSGGTLVYRCMHHYCL